MEGIKGIRRMQNFVLQAIRSQGVGSWLAA